MKKFTDRDGFEWAMLDVQIEDDCLIAEFVPFHMKENDSWQEDDVRSLIAEYEPQEVEIISGHEYPRFSIRLVGYDEPGFDKDMAAAIAFDQALEYLSERRVKNAA